MARTMQTVAPPAAPAATPATGAPGQGRFNQSVHSDVTVPLQASAITGALIASVMALPVGAIAYAQRTPFIDLAGPLLFGWIVVALVTMTAAWFWERHCIKQTWWKRELRDGKDYDKDFHVGPVSVEATQIRGGSDPLSKPTEEQLTQLRFEEFIVRVYNADIRTVPAIRRLGFTDAERVKFTKELRDAQLILPTRGGNSAAWDWVYSDAEKCLQLARKRVMWRIPSSSSSSSPGK
jgi:hypothetical protein